MTRWAILCNQTSGSHDPRRLERIQQVLAAEGITTRVFPTAYAGHATDLCRGMNGVDCVAVYGGDGTLNEAANGLLGRGVPLAFLPGGTANVMAHELSLPQDPVRAARLLAHGENRAIHPGVISGRAFLLMAGFGFDGMAVHRVSPRLKARVGKLAYVAAGLRAFAAPQPLLRVSGGAGDPCEAHWAVVSRARHYGGPYVMDPTAGLEQPELGLVAVPRRGLLPFLVGTLGLRLGRPVGGAIRRHGTVFHIQAAAPVWAQVDGEAFGSGRAFTVTLASQPLLLRFPVRGRT